jgi:hypothetical protein
MEHPSQLDHLALNERRSRRMIWRRLDLAPRRVPPVMTHLTAPQCAIGDDDRRDEEFLKRLRIAGL